MVLLLHCLILSIFAGILPDSNTLLKNAKKTTEECYCVPIKDSEMRVSEILDSELQQDERLVVYFYKNSLNEVTIYIPNNEKQKFLPEFTLDNNDLLRKNTTVNINNLFSLDNSDVMGHESNSRPANVILSNQPYLVTGYTRFLQIPQNFQNIPNCCDKNKKPSNVDTLHPQDVWSYIIPELSEENIYSDGIYNVWDLIIPQLNEDKPSNSDNVYPQGVLDFIISQSKEEKPSSSDNVHPQNGLDLIISQSKEGKPSNSDNVHSQDVPDLIISQSKEGKPSNSDNIYPQDVLDLIISQSKAEKSSNSDNVHPQGVLDLVISQLNKEKPSNSDNDYPQDVLDLIISQSKEGKPSNSDNIYSQDVLDLIISQLNKEKPSNSDNAHPQDVLDLIIPQSNKEKPSNSDNVHPQDVSDLIIPQSKEEKPSNSDNVRPQDVLDIIIAQLNKEKSSNSDDVHPQDVLSLIITQLNKDKPSNSDNDYPRDILDLIISQLKEGKPSNSDNVHPQGVLDLILAQLNKGEPSNSDNVYPGDVLDLIITRLNKENPSNSDDDHPKDLLDLIIAQLNKEKPSNSDNVHLQDVLDLIISQSKEENPLNSDNIYPQDVLDLIISQSNEEKPSNSENFHPQNVLDLLIAQLNKEKHTRLFHQNKTSGVEGHNGPSQISDHYIISLLNRPQMNYRPPSNAFGHITFDQWFSLQVNLLKKDKYVMPYAIDIEMLKILLQNTLYKNGISITNAGDLIDFNGQRLSIDSLELRPVLIGDPTKYEEFLSSHDCVKASKFPYIEAILVTLSKPRRFLGLISLSEASFFDTRISGSLICPPSSNGNSFSSVPIIPVSLVENSNGLWNRRSSPNDLPIYSEKIWRSEKINVTNDNDFEDISSPKRLGSEDKDYSDVGLRIIGGQAATSSGTPVSNKGRRSVTD